MKKSFKNYLFQVILVIFVIVWQPIALMHGAFRAMTYFAVNVIFRKLLSKATDYNEIIQEASDLVVDDCLDGLELDPLYYMDDYSSYVKEAMNSLELKKLFKRL